MQKTIAAISTAPAPGGIGIVRISGPQARRVAGRVFRSPSGKKVEEAKGYTALYGRAYDGGGNPVDEVIALVFAAPNSYTGEDVVELSCHGGIYITRRLLSAVLAAGARLAEAGEFTRRAYENGKLDLTQAEAVMDLISASGEKAAAAAFAAREGALGRAVSEVRETLLSAAAGFGAYVDFPYDDIPEVEPEALRETLREAEERLSLLLCRSNGARMLREGVRTVIAGRPNVGKSTLMNLLSGYEKSIVTPLAGTTRDVVEETVSLGGVMLRLADTAGLRDTDDLVEQIGVGRTKEHIQNAELVIAVFDASEPLTGQDEELIRLAENKPCIAIVNKTDLPRKLGLDQLTGRFGSVLEISAASGQGVRELEKEVERLAGISEIDPCAAMLANERQVEAANRARQAVRRARETMEAGFTLDAVSIDVDEAIAALSGLLGERVTEAVVNKVFHSFCVGK